MRKESQAAGRLFPALPTTVLIAVLLLALGLAGCGSTATTATSGAETTGTSATSTSDATTTSTTATTPAEKVAKLTLVVPPGPLAVPAAYLAAENKLSAIAESVEVITWENTQQLQALVAGEQADFVTMPSNNAAIFYNRGLGIQLLDITIWNITYLVGTTEGVKSFTDIKGQTLTVPFQGSVPDLMFQVMAKKEGLDPATDFDLRYATDPTQAAQLLLSGQVENAVLSEALATSAIQQSQSTETKLYRNFSFDTQWADTLGASAGRTPIAGTVATSRVLDKPELIAEFGKQYQAAVEWMLANPEEAGKIVEEKLPQLGLKAAILTASLQNITWEYVPALEAQADIQAFFTQLSELSPDVIGGKQPDDGFFYAVK